MSISMIWQSFITSLLLNILVTIGATSLLYWVNDRTIHSNIVQHRKLIIGLGGVAYIGLLYALQAFHYALDPTTAAFGLHWTFLNLMLLAMYLIVMETGSWLEVILWITLTGIYFFYYSSPVTFSGVSAYLVWVTSLIILRRHGQVIKYNRIAYYSVMLAFGIAGFLTIYTMYPRQFDLWFIVRQFTAYVVLGITVGEFSRLMVATDRREDHLRHRASHDELTTLANVGTFNRDTLHLYSQFKQEHNPFTMFEIDLDHFKAINDQYGHLKGNVVLRAVATELQQTVNQLNQHAKAYRLGGEEFCLIVQAGLSNDDVAKIALDFQNRLAQLRITQVNAELTLTTSIGCATVKPQHNKYFDVYAEADRYLYLAKDGGRDLISIEGELLPHRLA